MTIPLAEINAIQNDELKSTLERETTSQAGSSFFAVTAAVN